jgi:hypothetical protein
MEAIWIRIASALITIGATRPAGRFLPLLPDLGRCLSGYALADSA